jgi:hypothetical protein
MSNSGDETLQQGQDAIPVKPSKKLASKAGNSNPPTRSTMVTVVYVAPPDAKLVKKMLEEEGILSKRHRMIKVPPLSLDESGSTELSPTKNSEQIALPLTIGIERLLGDIDTGHPWRKLILGHGQRNDMPLSTSQFASRKH